MAETDTAAMTHVELPAVYLVDITKYTDIRVCIMENRVFFYLKVKIYSSDLL